MSREVSWTELLRRLWRHISPHRRVQLALLLALMVAASFAEIVSIGLVLPFVGILAVPEQVFAHPMMQPVIGILGIQHPDELVLPLTITFAVAVIVAGAIRLSVLWASTRISFGTGAEFSLEIYRRALYQDYRSHIERNSSEVIDGITAKIDAVIYETIYPILTMLASTLVIAFILAMLVAVDPNIALSVLLGFGIMYLLVAYATRKQVAANSVRISKQSRRIIQMLQEGLGGIRDVLIDGTQGTYLKIYSDADRSLRYAQGSNQIIAASPRFFIEALATVLFIFLAFLMSRGDGGLVDSIPILATLAVGAQRLLPVMQQGYGSWTNVQGARSSLQAALDLLDQPLPERIASLPVVPLRFKISMVLKDASFRYSPTSPWVLKDINLTIHKGSRVGIVGPTGCGKSTLSDIIMGLLRPTAGTFEVDGEPLTSESIRRWQAVIAHVPQSLFLADSSIEENIAFGVPSDCIDHARVRAAADMAQIAELIENWPDKYRTVVGEKGVRMSGGQRQRIGIARALYKEADVIILDEATAALDHQTERKVTQSIGNMSSDVTVIVIAHHRSSLEVCDSVIMLEDGRVVGESARGQEGDIARDH
jgi:ATP-binding cassette, subfamily B, bacterial PglK